MLVMRIMDCLFIVHMNYWELTAHMDRQALPRVLVDQVQEPHRPSIMDVGTHEVIRPDVIAMLWP
jgi:hypothetical protein